MKLENILSCIFLFHIFLTTFSCDENNELTEPDVVISNIDTIFYDNFENGLNSWKNSNLPIHINYADTHSSYIKNETIVVDTSSEFSKSESFSLLISSTGTLRITGAEAGQNFSPGNFSTEYKRHYDLSLYSLGDTVIFSFWILPIDNLVGDGNSFPYFELIILNSNDPIENFIADTTFFTNNIRTWKYIEFDLSDYTNWANDISFMIRAKGSNLRGYKIYDGWHWSSDYGGNSNLKCAIDDIQLIIFKKEL